MEPDHALSDDVLREVQSAAVNAGLTGFRGALLAGIDRALVASLPIGSSPAAQLRTDLDELNRTVLADGTRPIRAWLRNAEQLVGPRVEARIFRRALAALDQAPAAPAVVSDTVTTAHGRSPAGRSVLPPRLDPKTLFEVSQALRRVLRPARVPMEHVVAQLNMDLAHLDDDDWLGLVNGVHTGMHAPIGDGRGAVRALVEAARSFVPANDELRALAASLAGAAGRT